jgi:hypothetical protein
VTARTPCVAHWWLIPTNAGLVQGRCKRCKAKREFDNTFRDDTFGDRMSAASRGRRSITLNARKDKERAAAMAVHA